MKGFLGQTWRTGTLTYSSTGLAILFLLLLVGDFSWSMRDRSVQPMAQWYLSDIGVPNILFGLLITTFPSLIAFIFTPIVSVRSDRHRGKWGRRIPFLLVTTPLAASGMLGLGLTPLIARAMRSYFPEQSEVVVSIVCFGIFWAIFEFATIAGRAVFDGLINDVVPRGLLGRFYGLFRAVSLIDGIIFNYWIIGKVPDHFTLILIIIGLFYGVSFTWVCLQIREGEYSPAQLPEKASGGRLSDLLAEVRLYLRECFSSYYYISIFFMLTAATLTFVPVNIFSIPFAMSLNVNMELYGKVAALIYLISLSLSLFVGWMADAFHPLRMAMGTLVGYALLALWAGTCVKTQNTFIVAWILHGVLAGTYGTSVASLQLRLFPHAKFAQFASASGILISLAGMVFAPVMGMVIDQSGNIYRYVFTVALFLSIAALFFGWVVYRRFSEIGEGESYVAP